MKGKCVYIALLLASLPGGGFCQRQMEIVPNVLVIRVSDLSNGYGDESIIRLAPAATKDFDDNLDAFKLISPEAMVPSLYTKNEVGRMLSINSLPDSEASWLVPLFLRTNHGAQFQLSITNLISLDKKYHLYLALPEERCYIDWNSHYLLNFFMSSNDAAQAAFFLLFDAAENGLANKKICNLPEGMLGYR